MQVRLQDRTALLIGQGGDLGIGITGALTASGAVIVDECVGDGAHILVTFSQRGLPSPDWMGKITRAAHRLGDQGRVVNVVSVTGLVAMRGDGSAPMQAGIIALSRSLALELAPRGILVNALAVPPDQDAMHRMVSHTPGGRLPSVADLAQAALFLLDPDNTYTTGHVLVADGGWSVGFGRDF
jgi:NAD(P)-dependent dehydrogenase (short-subunit alcohol dehydrogenase family)